MIADLLELHQLRQHQSAPLNSLRVRLELLAPDRLTQLLIQRRLLAASARRMPAPRSCRAGRR